MNCLISVSEIWKDRRYPEALCLVWNFKDLRYWKKEFKKLMTVREKVENCIKRLRWKENGHIFWIVVLYIPAFGGHFYFCISWELNSWPWLLVPCFTVLYTTGLYIGEYKLNECSQFSILTHFLYWNKFREP